MQAKCPECGKVIPLWREKDGLGRARPMASWRFVYHAGRYFGRPCKMIDEEAPKETA